MTSGAQVEAFWQAYLASLPAGTQPPAGPYQIWHFGDQERLANELGELVRTNVKTATCGMLWEYEVGNEALPQVGELSIIINWTGEPLCLIETVEVEIKPFNQVGAQFAYDEGEGDRSLTYWRQAHRSYFTRRCQLIGRELRDDMPLVCERFQVIFR